MRSCGIRIKECPRSGHFSHHNSQPSDHLHSAKASIQYGNCVVVEKGLSVQKSVCPLHNARSSISYQTRSVEMNRIQTARGAGVALAVLSLTMAFSAGQSRPQSAPQSAKNEIKILDNPGGGQYAFGPMTSQSNKADALIYMLHQMHGKFGDKPQVGKLFQSRDGSSLATFFTLVAKNMGGSPVTGLLF